MTLANDGVGRHRFVDGLDWLYQRMERGDLELFGVGPLQSPADVLATSLREADGRLEPVD